MYSSWLKSSSHQRNQKIDPTTIFMVFFDKYPRFGLIRKSITHIKIIYIILLVSSQQILHIEERECYLLMRRLKWNFWINICFWRISNKRKITWEPNSKLTKESKNNSEILAEKLHLISPDVNISGKSFTVIFISQMELFYNTKSMRILFIFVTIDLILK